MAGANTQKRIQQRLNRMKRLFAHLALTLIITLSIVYGVDQQIIPARSEDDFIPVLVLLLIVHALWVMYQEAGHFIVQQETQRQTDDDEEEKPKHQLEVGDDGELVEVYYDDEPEKAKYQ